MKTMDILEILIEETGIKPGQIKPTLTLLEEGATVPFIARYRKEVTGELDEVQIRQLQERLSYFKELEERRQTILKSIAEQGKLSAELQQRILTVRQKTELEDLYLPYKPKRRTKAMIARERGLEPLAEQLLAALDGTSVEQLAPPFVAPQQDVPDVAAALQGAGHILAEQFADSADARAIVRQLTWERGEFCSQPVRGKEGSVSKYEMYYDYREALKQIPSHRMLAMRRGEKEEVLRLAIAAPEAEILARLAKLLIPSASGCKPWLKLVLEDAYHRLLAASIEVELRLQAKKSADQEAIRVFAENLRNLLLAAPVGSQRVLGVDPGLRTGSKLAVVDATGCFLEHATIYPHAGGSAKVDAAQRELLRLIEQQQVEMVAIGNGTAGREMEQFVRQTLKSADKQLAVVMISEAGASIYSASDIAREEFPELDLTVRGAISIARRLQDPLAELVKVDPKSIGVGQYQHDVSQSALKKSLDEVVESCVNYVGVDLNTASWALLSFVSGIGESLAKAIIRYRDEKGAFSRREQLLEVPRFGQKAFQQAAGFLRIRNAAQPLDNTAVHPERYPLVEQMIADTGQPLDKLLAEPKLLDGIDLQRYLAPDVGLPTLQDIIAELKKPGRDPRESFVTTAFREDVMEMKDLQEGMSLNGVVTNVAAFGAFVDIGVHQDGLVHVSQLADRFVKDPNDIVKVGQQVQVRVVAVDMQRKRISLSMRRGELERNNSSQQKPAPVKKQITTDPLNSWEKAGFRVKRKNK